MDVITATMVLFSILVPTKTWYAPTQPMTVQIKTVSEATLAMRDFYGKRIEPAGDVSIKEGQQVDLRVVFPQVNNAGAYILTAVPKDGSAEFLGTPLVITTRVDRRQNAPPGPIVSKIEPLCYAKMKTNADAGEVSMLFYYDVAPNTAASFLALSAGGFYDGLTFHRIVPGFVIQGGDPRGDGTGGPSYNINAEFNDRPHDEGVLSMARQGDPNEAPGVMPRPEFANSAGSQFFVCLDPAGTRQLDHRYTAFGRVFAGMDIIKKIAATPVESPRTGKPTKTVVIESIKVVPVTAKDNPYKVDLATQPSDGK